MTGVMEKLKHLNVTIYAVPGKGGFYEKLGFRTMLTAMGNFKDVEGMVERGYLRD